MRRKKMSKHTPGDWVIDQTPERALSIFDSDSCGILIAEIAGDADHPEVEANARLIAAAPELLEALRAVVKSHDDVNFAASGALGYDLPQPDEDSPIGLARAAIAKATNPE
jgi:hypothetical protein